MNTTKAVYNKLFSKKTELETHKVELSSIQELKSMLSSNDSEVNNFEVFKKEIETIIRRKKVNKKQTLASLKETKSVLDDFNKKVKELGLNAKDVKEYVNLSKSFSELQTIVSEYDKYNL
tara:strand:+ start:92 stop:451 length:360 start_codon:yes stop_codon:yes gene_type:complete